MDDKPGFLAAIEKPSIATRPEQIHTLLLESIDKVADEWVDQINQVRDNLEGLEKQILVCVSKVKEDITKLHNLGGQLTVEAKRGQDVIHQIFTDVEKLS